MATTMRLVTNRCDLRCENANPLNACQCQNCGGRCHGSRRITPHHLEALADTKLRAPGLAPDEESYWLDVLLAVAPKRRRRRVRRVA